MDSMELGGNIVLTGFADRDFTELIVVKKIVGQYSRKLSDATPDFGKLHVSVKNVHGGSTIEISCTAEVNNHKFSSQVEGHNLFVVLDEALKKVSEQVHKKIDKQER